MSPSSKKAIGFGTGFATMIVGALVAVPFLGRDAFANWSQSEGPLGGDTGIRMETVEMRSYKKGELVAQASLDTVDVRKDRQHFDFTGVKRGSLFSKEGKIDFSSNRATFDEISQQLRFDDGVRLGGKEFDLSVPRLTLDEQFDNIQAPGPITGTLKGGKFQAMDFKYKMANEEFMTGGIRWQGQLPQEVAKDAPGAQNKTPWDIEAKSSKGTKTGATYKEARATDGEIIVKAPTIDHDRKNDVMTCTGKVYYFSKKANMVADSAVIYRKEKRVILKGDVRMLVKPKDKPDLTEAEVPPYRPDVPPTIADTRPEAPTPEETQQQKDLDEALRSAKTVRDYPSMVKCDQVEYWYGDGNRHGIFNGAPEAFQALVGPRWRRVSAFKAFYDGEKETLRMESSAPDKREVHMVSSIGDDVFGWWFLVSTKEEDEDWEGEGLKGKVMADEDEVPKDKKTPPPTGGG